MSNLSLMTRREMKRHIDELECFPTLGLKEYDYLYFAFDNDSEFEDDIYSPLSVGSDDDLVLTHLLMNKKRKGKVTLLNLTKDSLEHIQKYARSFSFQSTNRFLSSSENRFIHHYWATNIHSHLSVGHRGLIHKDIIFSLACHLKYSHQNEQTLATLCQNWINSAFVCQLFSLHFCSTYDLSQPYHDIYPFPSVSRFNPMTNFTRFFRSEHELSLLNKINGAVMCFGCHTVSCCGALVVDNDKCEHKKGCPLSLWVRRLYTFQEVVLVTDLVESRLRDAIFNLGHPMYKCNFRLDQHTFNVNARGGALFRGRGGVGGLKMETIIKFANAARFNVYFDAQGNREPLRAMINRAQLGWGCTLCSNYRCLNFGHCTVGNHYSAINRRHFLVEYSDRARQHIRTTTEADLRGDMCYMFSPRSITFTQERREAVHNGDHSIDYFNPAVAASDESSDEENINPNVSV